MLVLVNEKLRINLKNRSQIFKFRNCQKIYPDRQLKTPTGSFSGCFS
jgi:hypothetical protein